MCGGCLNECGSQGLRSFSENDSVQMALWTQTGLLNLVRAFGTHIFRQQMKVDIAMVTSKQVW